MSTGDVYQCPKCGKYLYPTDKTNTPSCDCVKNAGGLYYKVIHCYLVWNEEDDCPASKPLWSERSAQEFADDMNRVYGNKKA